MIMTIRCWMVFAGIALLLSGCASSSLVAQWKDTQFAGQPPRGAKVTVVCQAPDSTLQRICVDRMSERLVTQGMQPIPALDADGAPADQATLLLGTRSVGATALLRTRIAPEVAAITTAPSFNIGIGGFSGGYGSGGGVGVGVSAPLGDAGPPATGYGASAALADVASGQLMWSGRASASPSSDLSQQLTTLSAQMLDAAFQSGLFPR